MRADFGRVCRSFGFHFAEVLLSFLVAKLAAHNSVTGLSRLGVLKNAASIHNDLTSVVCSPYMTRALSQNRQKEIGGGLRELPHVRQMDRPTMETESAEPEYPRLGLKQVWLNELFGQAWSRSWTCKESSVPEWFPPALQFARPCLGYGVVDPIELRIDGSRLTSICVGSGRPLARYLSQSFVPEGESYVRFLIEQMCFGLMRVHEGQGAVHGGLTPFNVMVTDRYHLNLWSVPTARLELSYGEKSRKSSSAAIFHK